MIIGLDFDGTCTTHDYPNIGRDIGAVPVLKKIVAAGHDIMLWSMRGNKPLEDGGINTLQDAVDWLTNHDIPLWGINENPEQTQQGWTNSNKQYAQLYIDDATLGCPLIFDPNFHPRPFVNWAEVETMLKQRNII